MKPEDNEMLYHFCGTYSTKSGEAYIDGIVTRCHPIRSYDEYVELKLDIIRRNNLLIDAGDLTIISLTAL